MAFNGNLSDLQIANIEALAGRESGVSNTGPAEEKKCYGGGHKMVCRCINSQPCTGTDCYWWYSNKAALIINAALFEYLYWLLKVVFLLFVWLYNSILIWKRRLYYHF